MMSAERARKTWWILTLTTAMATTGCSSQNGSDSTVVPPPGDSIPQPVSDSDPGTKPVVYATHAQLLAEASENYSFSSERNPDAVDTIRVKLPGGVLPAITIATATRRSSAGRLSASRFIGRLTSSGAYPRMGLAPGPNYIWRDSLGGATDRARTLIVPGNTTYPLLWLKHDADHTPLFGGSTALPRLVKSAQGYGACDSGCGPGHCVMQEASNILSRADSTGIFER